MNQFEIELKQKKRFSFGRNWLHYLKTVTNYKIVESEQHLCKMLQISNLNGKKFIDVGSGSGVMSLSARNLGAEVVSVDYDPQSVQCAQYLKNKYYPDDEKWNILNGSVLDKAFIHSLGKFDVVYSWGVLHHTGRMWMSLEIILSLCKPDSYLYLALYNDQGLLSKYWHFVKAIYNKCPFLRPILVCVYAPYFILFRFIIRLLKGRLSVGRGMNLWHDMIDWLGGYPFEVAKPKSIFTYFSNYGFQSFVCRLCGKRHGCNEYIFLKY